MTPLVQPYTAPAPTWLYRLVDPGVRSRGQDAHPVPLGEGECGILLLHDVEQFARLRLDQQLDRLPALLALLVTLAAAGDFGPRDGPHCGGNGLAGATAKLAPDGGSQRGRPYGAKGPGSSLPGRLLGEEAALLYRAVFHLGAGARDSGRTRQGEQADDDECTLLHDIDSGDDQDPMTPTPPWATPSPGETTPPKLAASLPGVEMITAAGRP